MLQYLDIIALVIALPVFVAADFSLAGYAAAAGAWLIGRVIMELADRRRREALRNRNRNAALGVTAFATMGRIWILAGAILLVGLLGDREDGLAAAIFGAVLVTFHLLAQFAEHVLHPEAEGGLR